MKAKYTVPQRLQSALEIRDMTQADLVRKTGINKASISQYLSGDYEPKTDRILLLADALNVDPVWLAGFDVPMEGSSIKKDISVEDAQMIIEFENDERNRDFILKYIKLSDSQKEAIQNIVMTMVGN